MNDPDGVWLFDVDGTLIGSVRSDVLRPRAVELLDTLLEASTTLVLWSAGGADYAQRMLERLDAVHYFAGFYAKDQRGPDGRYTVDHLPAHHRPGTLVDDYPEDVPSGPRVIRVPQFMGGNPNDGGLAAAIELARQARSSGRPNANAAGS